MNRAMATRTIQRNALIYAQLRDWPWWRLYTKIRPLLAATRSDDALAKKEAELLLARERAERDQREREAMETARDAGQEARGLGEEVVEEEERNHDAVPILGAQMEEIQMLRVHLSAERWAREISEELTWGQGRAR